jgi:hypothetical protein
MHLMGTLNLYVSIKEVYHNPHVRHKGNTFQQNLYSNTYSTLILPYIYEFYY